jgi:hypothetical protein
MPKTLKAPSGFYTAKEAMEKLRLTKGTFHNQVKSGKIKKHTPPNRKEGYYDKKEIDKMAQANALFTLIHSIEPITFEKVTTEEDLRGIVDLCIAIYGQGGTPSYDARLEIWQKNPGVYYIVKQEGIVVGYISLIWFDEEAINTLMGPTPKQTTISSAGTGIYSITGPEHILPFTPNKPIDHLFISMGVRPGLSNTEQRDYGFKLLRGIAEVLTNFAYQKMPVKFLYATSDRGEGIRLARKLGMKETKHPNDPLIRFELDLNEITNHPVLQHYREVLESMKAKENQKSSNGISSLKSLNKSNDTSSLETKGKSEEAKNKEHSTSNITQENNKIL